MAWARFDRFPAESLSTTTTSDSNASASARWLPMNPAPPVITIFDPAMASAPQAPLM